jgi:glucose/arabinose dehydrogenase
MRRCRATLATALCAIAVTVTAAPAAAGPASPVVDGFEDVTLLPGLDAPMAVRFAPPPDTRIFVARKDGVVLAFDSALDRTPAIAVDLRTEVHDFWDRGLLGMTLDPAFATNRRLYLLYARDAGAGESPPRFADGCPSPTEEGCVVTGRLVRVALSPLGEAESITPLIEDTWCQQFVSHSVGALAFGPDGMLYASGGEGASFTRWDLGQFGNPCGDPPGEGGALRAQDARTAGDPTGLSGTIVRVDPETGAAAAANPWGADPDANRRRIVAFGMRNPFRFTFRPGTAELWTVDVGNLVADEIDRIDTAAPDVPNLGWPCYEGTARLEPFAGAPMCASLPAAAVATPAMVRPSSSDGGGCDGAAGSALSGIAFHPGAAYGTELDGALFFADYARNCIWAVRRGSGGRPDFSTTRLFARGERGSGPVDLQIAPDGDLVYVHLDLGTPGASEVRRIRSTATNTAPVAALTADRRFGRPPLTVAFDASGSVDADRDTLRFDWDLDGDREFGDAATPTASRVYEEAGPVAVRVRVTDPAGEFDEALLRINPGGSPPVARIEAPASGERWVAGRRVDLRASATAPDGGLVRFDWRLTIEHCHTGGGCHTHPLTTLAGPTAAFTAPEHEYPSHIVARLTATAADGLDDVVTRALHPESARLITATDPAGLAVSPAGTRVIQGAAIELSAPPSQQLAGEELRFLRWSDGASEPTRTVRLFGDATFVARYLRTPVNAAAPFIRGTAREGARLSAQDGVWRGDELEVTRRWERCRRSGCSPMSATGRTYRLRARDAGRRLRLRVEVANAVGRAVAMSDPTPRIRRDEKPPRPVLSAPARWRLGRVLPIRAACAGEPCRLRARASLRLPGGRRVRTRTAAGHAATAEEADLALVFRRPARRRVRAALRSGARLTLHVRVSATDGAGNRSSARSEVAVRR